MGMGRRTNKSTLERTTHMQTERTEKEEQKRKKK
jgi:hypothetical protein